MMQRYISKHMNACSPISLTTHVQNKNVLIRAKKHVKGYIYICVACPFYIYQDGTHLFIVALAPKQSGSCNL